jgi:exopolyphosphatase / guanosine-5'-triphosphate,3'-diphosphate pyrophosphatase
MFEVDVWDTRDELVRASHPQSRTIAALDLGSNSFHLVVVEVGADARLTIVDRLKERIQLGESVFETGQIAPEAFERGLDAVRRMRDALRRHAPESVLAVATSAIREAGNGRLFVRDAERVAGFPISVVDGLEETRLVCLGTQHGLSLGGKRMALFDVGGGSTEVAVAKGESCSFTASLPLGTLRLRARLPSVDRPSARDLATLERHIAKTLEPTLTHVEGSDFDVVVLSCGVARTLQRLAVSHVPTGTERVLPGAGAQVLGLSALESLTRELTGLGESSRRTLAVCDPQGADTLLPGAIALRLILRRLGVSRALVSRAGLREGLVVQYLRAN